MTYPKKHPLSLSLYRMDWEHYAETRSKILAVDQIYFYVILLLWI